MLDLQTNEGRRVFHTLIAFLMLMSFGTLGFKLVGHGSPSLVDCLYMTAITVSTIGFAEVVDIHHPLGRLFTIFIALSGIGLLTYLLSQITAYVVEGHLKISLVNQRIEKQVAKLKGHYIICGNGRVGETIMEDLRQQGHDMVIIDSDEHSIQELRDKGKLVVVGDATDDDVLEKAGAHEAAGLFAVTGLDNQNLVITLSARLLNSRLKIIARCEEAANQNKMSRAGADIVVSPASIGALRMFHEMVNPRMTSFVDQLFFNRGGQHYINSVNVLDVPPDMKISDIGLKSLPHTLILAVQKKNDGELVFNPPRDFHLENGDAIIAMSCKEESEHLRLRLG